MSTLLEEYGPFLELGYFRRRSIVKIFEMFDDPGTKLSGFEIDRRLGGFWGWTGALYGSLYWLECHKWLKGEWEDTSKYPRRYFYSLAERKEVRL